MTQPNKSLQPTRDGAFSSASRFTSFDPAWLSLGRQATLRVMSHVAQGVFRVVGHLTEGWLTVEYVRHCDELPKVTPPPGARVISIRDDLWIDRVPVDLVAIEDRMPNTLLRVTVRERTEVIHVEREHVA